jgi:hypothetical protein
MCFYALEVGLGSRTRSLRVDRRPSHRFYAFEAGLGLARISHYIGEFLNHRVFYALEVSELPPPFGTRVLMDTFLCLRSRAEVSEWLFSPSVQHMPNFSMP